MKHYSNVSTIYHHTIRDTPKFCRFRRQQLQRHCPKRKQPCIYSSYACLKNNQECKVRGGSVQLEISNLNQIPTHSDSTCSLFSEALSAALLCSASLRRYSAALRCRASLQRCSAPPQRSLQRSLQHFAVAPSHSAPCSLTLRLLLQHASAPLSWHLALLHDELPQL